MYLEKTSSNVWYRRNKANFVKLGIYAKHVATCVCFENVFFLKSRIEDA